MHKVLLAIALSLVTLSVVPLSLASDVIEANAKNFEQIVLKSSVPVMVEFYAPYVSYSLRCSNCARTVLEQILS